MHPASLAKEFIAFSNFYKEAKNTIGFKTSFNEDVIETPVAFSNTKGGIIFNDIINREITKQTLNKCIQLAEKYKLSKMSVDEINEEVKAVRNTKQKLL